MINQSAQTRALVIFILISRSKKMKIFSALIVILLLWGCSKEQGVAPIPLEADCKELIFPDEPSLGLIYIIDSASYLHPSFNPNNPDEIIFKHKEYGTGVSRLYRYNLVTKEKYLIYTGELYFPSYWGSNDWIIMNPEDKNVWKIRPDGTGLAQLTNSNSDFYPTWSPDASMFMASRVFGGWSRTILYTSDAIPVDTLDNVGLSAGGNWSNSNMNCRGDHVADIYKDSIVFSITIQEEHTGILGVHWLNEEEYLWSYEAGIFHTNYITGITTLVKSSCRTREYMCPTYHPLKNKVIWQKVELTQLDKFKVAVKSRLYMMNTDGTEEEEIIIE
jgi:hypothetical protein